GLNYDSVLENCLRFIDLRNERGEKPVIQIRMILQEKNYHERDIWKEYWLSQVSKQDVVSSRYMHSWGNGLKSYESHEDDSQYDGKPCISPWSTVVIHADGKVPLCGMDFNSKLQMGDLETSTIKEIWNNEQFRRVREIHAVGDRNDIDLCIGCNVWGLKVKTNH
ncbi:hypothetical protein LCGC14_2139440, partial [marine sediment metagenome]